MIAQNKASGGEKETYDMDTGQRVVDYVIHPRIEANGRSNSDSGGGSEPYTTKVTIETTLPAKLHYIPDSSYQGGTYEQAGEGRQGSVSGGKLLDTIVTENPDGTTTLKYVFEVTVYWDQITGDTADLEPIYFSCDIGEAGTDNDVQDGDQLMVTTTIESTEDNIRPKDSKNGNSAYQTIRISKLASVSLVDRADHIAVDAKDEVGFTSTVVNESNNDRPSALIVHVPMVAENSKSILIFNNSSGDIVDEDVAYLSKEFSRLTDTIDGTAEFDAEDGPGYDSGPRNKIVRTFDTVTDKVEIYNDVYEGMDFTTYEKGYVGFEFVLKGTSKQVEFATDAMNWLDVKQADYATFEVEKDGKTYQVMRGRFLWESEDNTQPAIGAASQELGLAYTVLAMCNNETVQPYYTFWMEYNDVPQSDVAIGDFPTDNYIFVKDYSGACAIHGEKEPITIEGGQVKVSAAPWYNAQLKEAKPSSTRAAGYWDLKTGEYSADEETDTSIYGRSFCYGLTIQIRRPDGNGIKGCELPDGSDITIKLKLSELNLVGKSGTNYNSEGFDPVLWLRDPRRRYGRLHKRGGDGGRIHRTRDIRTFGQRQERP